MKIGKSIIKISLLRSFIDTPVMVCVAILRSLPHLLLVSAHLLLLVLLRPLLAELVVLLPLLYERGEPVWVRKQVVLEHILMGGLEFEQTLEILFETSFVSIFFAYKLREFVGLFGHERRSTVIVQMLNRGIRRTTIFYCTVVSWKSVTKVGFTFVLLFFHHFA